MLLSRRRFEADRDSIKFRIHVNGIRGKSSVTRYAAAILREAGLTTYGKTTGTAARVILPNGRDAAINRRGFPNVNEQVGIIRSFAARKAQAIVMECMAVNPDYQDWLERKIMHSNITVITNVRLDHQEEMGPTLTDIARSLARSIPRDSILLTAERQPDVLKIFAQECRRKHSRLLIANYRQVNKADLAPFDHLAHADNVAVGLEIAKLFGVAPKRALRAMAGATPDPGAFRLERFTLHGKNVVWANLFAVNDKESFAEIATMLAKRFPNHGRIALLNNRHDRPSRVEMFSELAQNELQATAIVATGDYEERIRKSVRQPAITVATMGNTSAYANQNGNQLLEAIIALTDQPDVLLVGAVNIHTRQSEHILEFLGEHTGNDAFASVPVYQPRLSRPSRLSRRRRPVEAHRQKYQGTLGLPSPASEDASLG